MKYIKFVFLIFNILIFKCNANSLAGEWINSIPNKFRNDKKTYFYAEKRSYTRGGVKFTYPEKYFSTAPFAYVSVELNRLTQTGDLILSPIVISNTEQEINIRVNKEKSGVLANVIKEASDDDVFVYIIVIGS